MIEFIILSTQRSGSAFLATSLSSHPRIHCYREMFLRRNRNRIAYRAYRNASLSRRLAHLFRRKQLVSDYLDELFAATGDVDAIGFKLMYNQARELPEVVQWVKEHNAKVIHLLRVNMLKTFVSHSVARARGVYHSTKALEPIKVRLDPAKVLAALTRTTQLVETYRGIFAGNPYLEVTYESFAAHRDDESRRVLEFLNVEPLLPLTTDLVKINPDSLERLIENYEEIVRALKGTAYEPFLG